MKLGRYGQLMPEHGFSRVADRVNGRRLYPGQTAYRSHDGLFVISALEDAYLPGSGDPPKVGKQWLVTTSRPPIFADNNSDVVERERCPVTNDDLARVVKAFAMPAFDEDNHHPGVARHLWCPVDEQYRNACECKLTEVTITEPNGYTWTTDADECRGCWYERMFGYPCPRHADDARDRFRAETIGEHR